jgi:hypothetical protein
VGREPAGHKQAPKSADGGRTVTGFVFFAEAPSVRSVVAQEPAHVTRVGRALLHLLGVPSAERGGPIEAASAKLRAGAGGKRSRHGEAEARGLPLTSDSLRELGLLSDSARAPALENAEASAAAGLTD